MDFKFKKGTQVQIKVSDRFASIFGGTSFAYHIVGGKITDLREYNGKPQYKVSGFVGWWDEDILQEAE